MAERFNRDNFKGRQLAKPQVDGAPSPSAINPLRANLVSPNDLAWQTMGTRQPSPSAINFNTLREMSRVCQPVAAITLTRQNQVARFAKMPRFKGDVGVEIRMRDPDAKPTKADKKRMREIEDFILRTGAAPDPSGLKRPGFDPFLRMAIRDGLTLDAMAVELREDRKGNLFDFHAIDAATIRLAAPSYEPNQAGEASFAKTQYGIIGEGFGGVPQPASAIISYVQLIDSVPYAEFTHQELAYWIRNPRTDLAANGYGFSELEMLIEIITGYLNGVQYNSRYFTHGGIPEGVLSLIGNYRQEDLDDFRRYWNSMVSGVSNSFRLPVMGFKDGHGLNWTAMKQGNREMEFSQWLDFLTNLCCAVYQIDREEIGMGAKSQGEPGGIGGAGNDATIQHSLSKGLTPLLSRIESGINDEILPRLADTDEFIFAFAGIDPDQEAQKVDLATKKVNAGLITVNDWRSEADMKPIDKDMLWGDAPANATLYQAYTMGLQATTQAAAGMDPNADPNAPPGGDPNADPNATQDPNDPQQQPNPLKSLPKINDDGSEEDDTDEDA